MVTVHQFKVWDHTRGGHFIQPLKSPAGRIHEMGGEIIPGTAEEVELTALDAHGRYDPRPAKQ
jgi:hypothetical protein